MAWWEILADLDVPICKKKWRAGEGCVRKKQRRVEEREGRWIEELGNLVIRMVGKYVHP
jgi:hypothetical protein